MNDQWLSEVRQQIQVLDMELQAGLRAFAQRIDPNHVVVFMDALVRRDRLMANVVSYMARIKLSSG